MQANTIIKPKATSKNIIRPNIPIRPNQCDFCGRQFTSSPTNPTDQVNSIGRTFRICPCCKSKFQNHKCIMCNTSTEDPVTHQIIEWKGLCERCNQKHHQKHYCQEQQIIESRINNVSLSL